MDSSETTIPYRSLPLIQRGDATSLGGRWSAGQESAAATERAARRDERTLRGASSVHEGGVSRRARGDAGARRQREHVSAYLDESTAGRVTKRSERRSGSSSWEGQTVRPERESGPTGFSLVGGGAAAAAWPGVASSQEAFGSSSAGAGRTARAQRTMAADAAVSRRRAFDDYEDASPRNLPGWESRRSAVVNAACFVPETVGSAVLGLFARMRVAGVAVVATILIVLAALYGPVRNLYVTNRKLGMLQQTCDALLAENASIQSELEYLQTREGIENEARERGYVTPGETKVVVNGLPEEETVVYTPEEIAVSEERPWYVRLLDTLFDYEPEG